MRVLSFFVLGLLVAQSLALAQEKGTPERAACDLVALATPRTFQRSNEDDRPPFRMVLRIRELLLGHVPEGRSVAVFLEAPLSDPWRKAARSLFEKEEAAFIVRLTSMQSGAPANGLLFRPAEEDPIRPATPEKEAKIREAMGRVLRKAIIDLDAEDFHVRESAEGTLRRFGLAAENALREALEKKPSPEVALRANKILLELLEYDLKERIKRRKENPEAFKALEEEILRAKPKGKKWGDLTEDDRKKMASTAYSRLKERGFENVVKRKDVTPALNEVWRRKLTEEKELPRDDTLARWKKLVGKRFETIRRIDLRDAEGFLQCPQVDVYEDAGKTRKAGQMNHDEWVIVLEESGEMTKVKRRKDKKVVWIETNRLRRVYTKEDIEKGAKGKKD